MAVISNLSVSLTANMRGLDRGLKKARRRLKSFKDSVFNVKTAIAGALGVGGVGAVINSSLGAWRTQEMAVASLEAANNSMGRSTVNLTDNMKRLASQLQREGIIGDEAILQGMSFLSTYSQIPDELLPRATRAMVDLMAKTGESGQSAANKIGKAAMGMIGPLQIAGITISDGTKAMSKNQKEMQKMADKAGINLRGMVDNGSLFKSILTDIESQIGGTNKTLAATNSGAILQLKNSLGDLNELLGKIVSSGIGKWARQLSADIDNSKISVDGMAMSFKKWMTETILNVAPLVQAFKGIQLVVKSLNIAFSGFGLLVTGTFRNLAEHVRNFGRITGTNIGQHTFSELDRSYNKQLKRLDRLKNEASTLVEEISNRSFESALQNKLKEFDRRATITDAAVKAGVIQKPVTAPKFQGKIEKLIINPGSTDIRLMNIPQLDKTNELLGRMLGNRPVAVAG